MSPPVVAIVSNSRTPYRVHFHRRLASELPGFEWWSLLTHGESNSPWSLGPSTDVCSVPFGPGELAADQSKPRRALHEFRKGGRVIAWLKERRAAAVILLGYNDAGRLRILRWCRRAGVPCLLFGDSNIRGDETAGVRGVAKRLVLPRILRELSGVLCCGRLGREYFRRYGVPDDRIWYTPYEPDYRLMTAVADADIAGTYQRFGLPRDRRHLMYCGRLVAVKRVDLLIDAFAALAAERTDWDLLLVGDGPLREALCGRLPAAVRPRVRWAGFVDDQTAIARLMCGADAFVLPSDYEPWGVVINEAVAAGLAVVASDAVGAAAELVRDGVNGRIFPRGDRAGLTSALRDVTAADRLSSYRSASAAVLADWREAADPVAGIAAALNAVGVRSSPAARSVG